MNSGKLNQLIAVVKLEGIRLVKSSTEASIREADEAGEVSINVSRNAKVPSLPTDGCFRVLATIRARVQGAEAPPLVSVQATFELTYGLPDGFAVSADELRAFAKTNGVFNAWPYWREFLQSTLQRMSLPPIVLPLLTMKQIVTGLVDEHEARVPAPEKAVANG